MPWHGEEGEFATDHLVTAAEWNSQRLPYYVDSTTVDMVSTAAVTGICSVTVPGGTLGTAGAIRLLAGGDYLNNSGAGRTLLLSLSWGTTTFWQDTSASIAANASRHAWSLEVNVANLGSLASNFGWGRFRMGSAGGAAQGIGDLASVTQSMDVEYAGTGTMTENTATDKALALAAQHSAADANLSFRCRYAVVQVFPALT